MSWDAHVIATSSAISVRGPCRLKRDPGQRRLSSMTLMTIGKMAKACDVAIDTVRYYERVGLLPPPQRTPAGYRLYPADSMGRLRFIRRAKALGFSLKEIGTLLLLSDQDGPSAQVKQLTQHKLAVVNQKIHDLQRMRTALQSLNESCSGAGHAQHCPIIDALSHDEIA
jgi:MerR family copper efflux transcriptional regulator